MKETKIRAAPKLQFSEEELDVEGLKKPVLQVEKAAAKRDRMKAKLRKEHGPKKKTADAPKPDTPKAVDAAKAVSTATDKPILHRLRFEDDAVTSVPKKPAQGIVKRTVSAEIHKQIAQDEDENTGLQAIHMTEQGGESALHTVQRVRQSKLQHDHSKLVKAEKKLDHANVRYLQKE